MNFHSSDLTTQTMFLLKQNIGGYFAYSTNPDVMGFGRGDGTWTHGLFVPNEALYQAELHLEIMGWQPTDCQPFLAGAEGFEPSARGFGVIVDSVRSIYFCVVPCF